jgi:riboflavin biosynthesis pyrimidine reductase
MTPAERLKRDIRARLRISGEIQLTQLGAQGNVATVLAEVGQMVTESFIQADYYDRHFVRKRAFKVKANKDTGALLEVLPC